MRLYMDWYAGDHDARDPRISPLRAGDLVGLAPAVITTAGFDPLRDEGAAYARRLIEAHVPVAYLPMPTMMHGWWSLLPVSKDALAELERLTRAIATLGLNVALEPAA
jgi:acetyl esterase